MASGVRPICPQAWRHSRSNCRQCHVYHFAITILNSHYFLFAVLNQGMVLKKAQSNRQNYFYFLFNLYCIFPITTQSPYILLPQQSAHCCPHPWALFPFCSIPPARNHPPTSCHLLSVYESVSVSLVSSVCSLYSTCECTKSFLEYWILLSLLYHREN